TKASINPLTSAWRGGGRPGIYLVLGFDPTPGKILPKKLQKEEEGCDWTIRPWGAGRWRRLSAKAISTWRAIKTAVCRVASVVKRSAISQTPPAKILKITTTVPKKTTICCRRRLIAPTG